MQLLAAGSGALLRLRESLGGIKSSSLLCYTLGVAISACHVAWLFLTILFADLMLSEGKVSIRAGDLSWSKALTGTDRSSFEYSGLFPLVVEAHHHWYGGIVEWIYRNNRWTHENLSYLSGLLIVAFLVGLIAVGLNYWHRVLSASLTTKVEFHVLRSLFQHQFLLGPIEGPAASATVKYLIDDRLPSIIRAFYLRYLSLTRDSAHILFAFLFVVAFNPWLGLCVALLAAIAWVLGSGPLREMINRREELRASYQANVERLSGFTRSLPLLFAHSAEGFFHREYEERLGRAEELATTGRIQESRIATIGYLAFLVIVILVLGISAQNVLIGKFALASAIGVIVALVSLRFPVRNLIALRREEDSAEKAAAELLAFIDQTLPPKTSVEEGNQYVTRLINQLEVVDVTYRDSANRLLIDRISFKLEAGKKLAILAGHDQEGVALLELLSGRATPTDGVIRFDGVELKKIMLDSFRELVSAVFQNHLLIPDTVSNNISLGSEKFTSGAVVEAAKLAHVHQFVQKLPHGYECPVGDNGFPLKLGEMFRIGLARAILRDPSVVLIEEPNEELDEATDSLLSDTMNRFLKGRTAIILARRATTLRSCDLVALISEGRLVALDTPSMLADSSDYFRYLVRTRIT